MLSIRFWGVRGSLPISDEKVLRYGGSTSCVEISADNGARLVFDAGTGIHPLGLTYIQEGAASHIAVFITHPHWDHIQGLPFFAPAFVPGNFIAFYGCDQGTLTFEDVLRQQMQSPFFPVQLTTWKADIKIISIAETEIPIHGVTVQSMYAEHPGMTLAYKVSYKGSTVVYMPDNELFAQWGMGRVLSPPQHDEHGFDMESVFLEEQKRKFFGFIDSADLLIHDAQYTPEEYPSKIGWGHADYEFTVRAAMHGSVRHLALFHHDPGRTDDEIDLIVEKARTIVKKSGSAMRVTAASQTAPPLTVGE